MLLVSASRSGRLLVTVSCADAAGQAGIAVQPPGQAGLGAEDEVVAVRLGIVAPCRAEHALPVRLARICALDVECAGIEDRAAFAGCRGASSVVDADQVDDRCRAPATISGRRRPSAPKSAQAGGRRNPRGSSRPRISPDSFSPRSSSRPPRTPHSGRTNARNRRCRPPDRRGGGRSRSRRKASAPAKSRSRRAASAVRASNRGRSATARRRLPDRRRHSCRARCRR